MTSWRTRIRPRGECHLSLADGVSQTERTVPDYNGVVISVSGSLVPA